MDTNILRHRWIWFQNHGESAAETASSSGGLSKKLWNILEENCSFSNTRALIRSDCQQVTKTLEFLYIQGAQPTFPTRCRHQFLYLSAVTARCARVNRYEDILTTCLKWRRWFWRKILGCLIRSSKIEFKSMLCTSHYIEFSLEFPFKQPPNSITSRAQLSNMTFFPFL